MVKHLLYCFVYQYFVFYIRTERNEKFLTRLVVHNDDIMKNCTNGNYYRKDDVFYSGNYGNDGHKIGIILNLDDICQGNPLGVRAKTYKYCMIYYTIVEIPQ